MAWNNKFRWKPSQEQKQEYVKKMEDVNRFIKEKGINRARSGSLYFHINDQPYRVSSHSIDVSDRGAFPINPITGERDMMAEPTRQSYHKNDDDVIDILASPSRIMEIYNDLEQGFQLDSRGRRKGEKLKDKVREPKVEFDNSLKPIVDDKEEERKKRAEEYDKDRLYYRELARNPIFIEESKNFKQKYNFKIQEEISRKKMESFIQKIQKRIPEVRTDLIGNALNNLWLKI